VKLTAYDQIEAFDQLKLEWNVLLNRSTANRIFSTWEWQSTWWDAYHPGQLWIVECRDNDGRLLGLGPWFIEDNPTYGRIVRSIGCVEVTDYLDIILDKDFADSILDCFAFFLAQNRQLYDVIDLCNLPETSPTYHAFPDSLKRQGFQVSVSQQEVCPVINLPATWDEYLETLDKKQRHEIRRKIRRAESSAEQVQWYIVDPTHDLSAATGQFMALMAASHSQKALFLEDTQNADFFKKVVPVVSEKGWLQLSFLTIEGEPVAAYLNFDYQGQILVYNSGLLPGKYDNLSPGIVLLAYNIRHAIETNHTVFDFLRGNETYKYRMGAKDTGVYMLRAQFSRN
jgi:CelD/BcsL family acetyltransferase involved in cellulose biosynthesis